MAGRPSTRIPSVSGARLTALRKAAGLSQAQLAKSLGIPQTTLSFYERGADYIPSTLLPSLARVLSVSVEDILGINGSGSHKRGPKSRVERQIEAIADLPRQQQQHILRVVEAFVSQHSGNGHKQTA